MAKTSEPSADLAAAQKALQKAHAKLVKEFEKIHRAKFSAASHQLYLEKLKAHLIALEAHTTAIRAQHEALHTQREVLHQEHESKGLHSVPPPRKSGNSRPR